MGIGADVGPLRWGSANIEWSLSGVWKALNYILARWGECASARMLAYCDGVVKTIELFVEMLNYCLPR